MAPASGGRLFRRSRDEKGTVRSVPQRRMLVGPAIVRAGKRSRSEATSAAKSTFNCTPRQNSRRIPASISSPSVFAESCTCRRVVSVQSHSHKRDWRTRTSSSRGDPDVLRRRCQLQLRRKCAFLLDVGSEFNRDRIEERELVSFDATRELDEKEVASSFSLVRVVDLVGAGKPYRESSQRLWEKVKDVKAVQVCDDEEVGEVGEAGEEALARSEVGVRIGGRKGWEKGWQRRRTPRLPLLFPNS